MTLEFGQVEADAQQISDFTDQQFSEPLLQEADPVLDKDSDHTFAPLITGPPGVVTDLSTYMQRNLEQI